jgi:alkanesulfonate monooxygenase SsuD/methylene tetrahydromethanopterin reductase-like flavin-dependent oxidoreductase (luciferase family)
VLEHHRGISSLYTLTRGAAESAAIAGYLTEPGIGLLERVRRNLNYDLQAMHEDLAHMREFIALLRECLSGNTVTFAGDYYKVRKFRLGVEPGARRPKIVLGALSEGMLRLAGREADGVLLNYLPASHVSWCVEQVRRGGDARIYANIHVGVGGRAAAAPRARHDLFSYAVVDAYARSFTRADFGDAVKAIRAAHLSGDRAGALAAVPDEMVDAIDVVGDEALVRDTISAYRRAGVDVPVVFPLTWGTEGQDALESTLRAAIAPPGATHPA